MAAGNPFSSPHSVKKLLHIARNGQVLGQFETDKVAHYIETGRLVATDHYFDEGTSTWLSLDQWKEPEIRARVERPETKPDSRSGNSRQRPKPKKKSDAGLAGWITCLFIIGIAAGLWVWNQSLAEEIRYLKESNTTLKGTSSNLQRANDALNEITPSGLIRGIIIYEPAPNQTAIVSGATVGLYERQDVEKAIEAVKADTTLNFSEKIERLKTQLPSPLAVTLTDSNGRISLNVPAPGDYILVASAAKGGGADSLHFLWMAGFKSENRPSLMVLLDEKNAISEQNTDIRIRDIRALAPAE